MKTRHMQIALAAALVALPLLAGPSRDAAAGTLFGLIDTGALFASDDGGASWTIRSTLPVSDAVGLAARFTTDELYLASASGTVYRSDDAGANWTAAGSVGASDVVELAFRLDGALLVATRTGVVYESTDLGASFDALGTMTVSDLVSLWTTGSGDLVAITRTGTVFASGDDGVTWSAIAALPVSDAVRIRRLGPDLFVLTGTGTTYRSQDGGASWTAVGTLSQVGVRGLAASDGQLYAATREGHVAGSASGASWTWQGSINQLTLTGLSDDSPVTTGVDGSPVAVGVQLTGPFPNPSIGSQTVFTLRLDRPTTVAWSLYDLRGRRITARPAQALDAGPHRIEWRVPGLAAGSYVARVTGADGRSLASARWTVLR